MPLDKSERAELEAHKNDVVDEVKGITDAAIRHVEKVVAPFQPLAQDVAQLKRDTAQLNIDTKEQTPIIKKLWRESRRAAKEREKRATLDEQKHLDAAKWKRRYRTGLLLLGGLAGLAELYRALNGHG